MNLARFDQPEDLALAHAGQKGGGFRRDHFDEGVAARAKSAKPSAGLDRNQLFSFESDFGRSFHFLNVLFTFWTLISVYCLPSFSETKIWGIFRGPSCLIPPKSVFEFFS